MRMPEQTSVISRNTFSISYFHRVGLVDLLINSIKTTRSTLYIPIISRMTRETDEIRMKKRGGEEMLLFLIMATAIIDSIGYVRTEGCSRRGKKISLILWISLILGLDGWVSAMPFIRSSNELR